jgi:hypothetical protein
MFKKILVAFIAFALLCINFNQPTISQAAISSIASQYPTALPIQEFANSTPLTKRQIVPKIINGELDLESNIKMTAIEKKNRPLS